ncbi:uncharacterized protein LOC126336428 isoform X1 [Schistocerca gregaria]|uniref:uncharacterized protein LOC126336428 isoform X1 n=1 Tax=Schistocerca gregaria TaxID=7010 RepID=UPI00211DB5F9|nr:uncharacterized protein LOC126336428 isoform X1 [Schistocerca gregaria]
MEPFYSLLCFVGLSSACSSSGDLDIVGMLPPEIAVMILRLLLHPSTAIDALVLVTHPKHRLLQRRVSAPQWLTLGASLMLLFFFRRNLDGPSLLSASEVNASWLSLIQSDSLLARRLKRQKKIVRAQREARVFAAGYQPLRTPHSTPKPFADRNGRFAVTKPDNGGAQLLAEPLAVNKAVKRKSTSSLQSAKHRFAADRRVMTTNVMEQLVKKAMRF